MIYTTGQIQEEKEAIKQHLKWSGIAARVDNKALECLAKMFLRYKADLSIANDKVYSLQVQLDASLVATRSLSRALDYMAPLLQRQCECESEKTEQEGVL